MRVMSQRYSNMDCSMSLHKGKIKMTLTKLMIPSMQAPPTDTQPKTSIQKGKKPSFVLVTQAGASLSVCMIHVTPLCS